jgi:hypothetical protein
VSCFTSTWTKLVLSFRRGAVLGAILGAHLLLFSLISVNDSSRGVRRPEEAPAILIFVDLPEPNDSQPLTQSSSRRPIKSRDAADNTITLPPELERTDALVDWDAEASRVAGDAARRMSEEKKELRSLDSRPAGMGPPPPKRSGHRLGDSAHFEGGEIITWIGKGCYYSNQNEHIDAFGPALRLQVPKCTGAGGEGAPGKPFPSIEEWKKERDERGLRRSGDPLP